MKVGNTRQRVTQSGGPGQYSEPLFRKIVGNAITWAASSEAHDWAQHCFQESGKFS